MARGILVYTIKISSFCSICLNFLDRGVKGDVFEIRKLATKNHQAIRLVG